MVFLRRGPSILFLRCGKNAAANSIWCGNVTQVSLEGQAFFRRETGVFDTERLKEPHEVNSTTLKYTITIKPNTNYTVRICTVNKAGCGNLSGVTPKSTCTSPPIGLCKHIAYWCLYFALISMELSSVFLGSTICHAVLVHEQVRGGRTIRNGQVKQCLFATVTFVAISIYACKEHLSTIRIKTSLIVVVNIFCGSCTKW